MKSVVVVLRSVQAKIRQGSVFLGFLLGAFVIVYLVYAAEHPNWQNLSVLEEVVSVPQPDHMSIWTNLNDDALKFEGDLSQALDSFHYYQYLDFQRASSWVLLAAKQARDKHKKGAWAEATYWHAWLLARYKPNIGSESLGLSEAKICAKQFEELSDAYGIARSYELMGSFLSAMDERDSALACLAHSEAQLKNVRGRARDSLILSAEILHTKALASSPFGKMEMYFLSSLELFKEAGELRGMIRNLDNLGSLETLRGQYRIAKRYFHQALYYTDGQLQLAEEEARVYAHLGRVYNREAEQKVHADSLARGIGFLRKGLVLANNQKSDIYNNLGIAFEYLKDKHNDITKRDSAEKYYKLAIEEAVAEDDRSSFVTAQENLRKVSSEDPVMMAKRIKRGFRYLDEKSKEKLTRANSLTFAFESWQTYKESKRKLFLFVLWNVLFLAIALVIWGYYRQKLKITYYKSRLEALQAQMHPHFISNSLNTIDGLITLEQNEAASAAVIQFANLCRSILDGARQQQISLSQEIQLLNDYLKLERLRFRTGKLNWEIEVEEQLQGQLHLLSIPPMVLQPYVENAVWHGIFPKASSGHIYIRFKLISPQLLSCEIEDDGVGLPDKDVLSPKQRKSWAMQITQERMEALSKAKQYRIAVIDKKQIGEGTGVKVCVELPIIAEKTARVQG